MCRQGACVVPVVTACGRDRDCPGDEICKAGTCALPTAEDLGEVRAGPAAQPVAPRAAPAQPQPRAAPASAPSGSPPARACGVDRDCPGDLVCSDRFCVSPVRPTYPASAASAPAAAPPPPEAAPAPVEVRTCRRDRDCPGEQICTAGSCVQPEQPRAAPPTPAPTQRFLSQGSVVRDTTTNLTWQKGVASKDNTAQVFADQICRDLELAGRGWRLPRLEELLGLTTLGGKQSKAASLVFDDFGTWVWSSTEESRLSFWAVNLRFGNKLARQGSDGSSTTVRCVR